MAKVNSLNLSKEVVQRLQMSGIEDRLRDFALEFLKANTPKEHKDGWDVETALEETGFKIIVNHTQLDIDGIALFEYGLGEDGVVSAPIRKLIPAMEDEIEDAVFEELL